MTRKVTGSHKIGISLKGFSPFQDKRSEAPLVMGNVPRLAEGAVNPMWTIQANLPKLAKRIAPLLQEPKPKKKQKMLVQGKDGYFTVDKIEKIEEKIIDIPDED